MSWTHACVECGHLANVHTIRAEGQVGCEFCACMTDPRSLSRPLTERVARANHAAELAWIEARWP